AIDELAMPPAIDEPAVERRRTARPAVPPKPVPPPIAVDDELHRDQVHKAVAELGLEDFEAAIERDQVAGSNRRPPVVYGGDEPDVDPDALAHAHRKRRLRRVPMLLGAMVLLCGLAGAAIWFLMPAK